MYSTGDENGGGKIMSVARGGRAAAVALVSLLAVVFAAAPAQAATSVKISRVYYNSPGTDDRSNTSLNAEYVNVQNISTVTQVVTGWTVRDAANHVYTFPSTSIPAGGTVTVHTGKGTNSGNQRYWGSGAYIWNNDTDTAYLRNSAGTAIFTCSYNSTAVSYKNC
jgi:hypothetical protein